MAVDIALALDLAILTASALTTVAGITPPFRATKEQKSRVASDRIRQFFLATDALVILTQIAVVALAGVEWYAVIRAKQANDVAASLLGHAPKSTYGISSYLARWTSTRGAARAPTLSSAQQWLADDRVRSIFRVSGSIGIAGGLLRLVCFRELGRFFTFDLAVHDGHKVIQSGPYALVRHPSYTAMLLLWTGEAVAKGVFGPLVPPIYRSALLALVAFATFLVIVLVSLRIRDEEAMLSKQLGDEYRKYMVKVPARLIPLLF